MSFLKAGENWLRQTFGWSNSWPEWQERLIGLTFVLVATGLVHLSLSVLAFWQAVVAWGFFALALAFLAKQGWFKVFGPVLLYDMIRTARRSRYSIIRIIYGTLLVFILAYTFLILYLTLRGPEQFQRREQAMLSQTFFATLMVIQLTIVILLTPAYVAGSIAEEKERKTLEFLLATDLASREIVLSKLFSRLGNMTLLLLTGLPILSILQFIGGVDTELMLSGFAAVGLTMLGIGSLSILMSTLFKRPRDAISLTYLLMVAYAALSGFGLAMQTARHPIMTIPLWFNENPPTINDVSVILNAGNPLTAFLDVVAAIQGVNRMGARTSLATELPVILHRYAWFHLSLTAICIGWSILRLRGIALKQTPGGTTAELSWWQRYRPPVSEFPMFWKEFVVEGRMRFSWLIWLAIGVLVLLTLGTGIWISGHFLWEEFFGFRARGWRGLSEAMNIWYRVAGTIVSCLLLLMVAVRASTCISTERERDTFEALIATPMSSESILVAKLLGNLLSVRYGWLWLGSMLLLALCTGGVSLLAVPVIIVSWFVYALFCTMLGLYFSMLCNSSMHASVATVLTTLILGGAHWLITSCFCMPFFGVIMMTLEQHHMRDLAQICVKIGEYFIKFQAGLTPPFVFAWCSFSWQNLERDWNHREFGELLLFSLLGLVLWTFLCVIVWFALLVPTFRRVTRRVDLI